MLKDIEIHFCSFMTFRALGCSQNVVDDFLQYKNTYENKSVDKLLLLAEWFINRNCNIAICKKDNINFIEKVLYHLYKFSFYYALKNN